MTQKKNGVRRKERKKTKPIWAAPCCIHGMLMLEGQAGRQAPASKATSAQLERFILRTDQDSGIR
jgi:hypothetical protein